MIKKVLSIILSLLMIFASISLSTKNIYALEISQDVVLENEVLNEDIYVSKDVTLNLNGDVTINGNMYVLGTVNNNGNLTITGTLNCLNYNNMMFAGDYDYGYFYNYGKANINSLNVTDSWLNSSEIPEDPTNYSGNCGRNMTYMYNPDTKTLTLSGSGVPYESFSFCDYIPIDEIKNIKFINFSGEQLPRFNNFVNIEEFVVPNSIKILPDLAFDSCLSLKNVVLPNNIITIPPSCFRYCKSLKEIDLPATISTLDNEAFRCCESLEEITIPEGVTELWGYTFNGCINLKKVNFSSNFRNFLSEDFSNCSSLKEIILPKSTETIGINSFIKCVNLQKILIPKNTIYIDNSAFDYSDKVIIYGAKGSYAEEYANRIGIPFKECEHQFDKGVIAENQPCDKKIKIYTCELCGQIKEENCSTEHIWDSEYTIDRIASSTRKGQKSIHCKLCNEIKEDSKIVTETSVSSIKFTTSNNIKLGENGKLSVIVLPRTSYQRNIKYESSDNNILFVDINGNYEAKKCGEVTIKATTFDGKTATCKITVSIPITSGKLNKKTATVKKGKTLQLKVTFLPENYTEKEPKIRWSSDNKKVATVDSNGKVTAMGPGQCDIFAVYGDNELYCQLTVPYVITYKLNGGKNNKSNPSSYYGKKIILKNPTRKGYTFSGWYSDSKLKKKITSFSSGNKTLYAKWTKVKVNKAKTPKLTNVKGKKLKITYSATSGAKGYQIQYSTSKKFTKATTKTINGKSATYTLVKKTYYVRVRAYKTDSTGAKVYGSWSTVKSIKIKK